MLKALREAAGLTNGQASRASGVSTAKLSRLETGRNVVYAEDVQALLDAYDATSNVRDKVLKLAALAEQHGWWEEFDDILPADFDLYLSIEEAAASLLVFGTSVVHGLLQIEDYARAWIRAEDPGMPNAERERLLGLRIARQRALHRKPEPLLLWTVFDEAVLRRKVGGPAVMRAQVEHLLAMSELPNVTIQVLPFDAGAHAGSSGSFTLVEFAEPTDPETGYVDCAAGNVYPEKPAQVRTLKTRFHHLTSSGLTPGESLSFMHKIAKELA
ncbi:helix-turn-helix domain-containing protein [Herbihabitans rhizosphaerae]|uniref:helix-turn-helix domain-containing protein n=1 Tax=Herbihabitans rhizosphaerae TaxID=1872711 RepID=UPI0013EEC735|nr:helix-turn-helix transcriptional regulator [Herbihabitans rhizosphaerae]